jgi:hypothetical protein
VLLRAVDLAESDIGACEWDRLHNADLLTVADDGQTIVWESPKPTYTGKLYPPAWVPATTRLHLHSGTYHWDFVVEEMKNAQIGVGFMLLWDVGPDWGFFGYLGSSVTAWSYDPSTGDSLEHPFSQPRTATKSPTNLSVTCDRFRQRELSAELYPSAADTVPFGCLYHLMETRAC